MPAFLRSAAIAAAAAAFGVTAPAAADASTPPYTPPSPSNWSGTACAGRTFTHTVAPGTFDAARALTASITGAGAAAPSPAMFLAARTTYSMTSNGSGGAVIALRFPASAAGAYNVSIAEQGTGKVSYGAITVEPAGVGVCPAIDIATPDPVPTNTSNLAVTGTHVNAGIAWFAGGFVMLGAVLAAVVARRRQARQG
jgi:hypothetical protein